MIFKNSGMLKIQSEGLFSSLSEPLCCNPVHEVRKFYTTSSTYSISNSRQIKTILLNFPSILLSPRSKKITIVKFLDGTLDPFHKMISPSSNHLPSRINHWCRTNMCKKDFIPCVRNSRQTPMQAIMHSFRSSDAIM